MTIITKMIIPNRMFVNIFGVWNIQFLGVEGNG